MFFPDIIGWRDPPDSNIEKVSKRVFPHNFYVWEEHPVNYLTK